MAHQLVASFKTLLADDPREFAAGCTEISTAWAAFTEAVQAFNAEIAFDISTVRTSKPIEKRGRKKVAGNDKQSNLLPPVYADELRKQAEAQSMAHQPRYTPGQGPPFTAATEEPEA